MELKAMFILVQKVEICTYRNYSKSLWGMHIMKNCMNLKLPCNSIFSVNLFKYPHIYLDKHIYLIFYITT